MEASENNKNVKLALKLLRACMNCSVLEEKDYVGILGFCLALNRQNKGVSFFNNLKLQINENKILYFYDFFSREIPKTFFTTISSILETEHEIDYTTLYEEIISISLKDFHLSHSFIETEIPKEVSHFITKLNGGLKGLNIYIPIAGGASLLTSNSKVERYEADTDTWLIGLFRLTFRGIETTSYINKDFSDREERNATKYDVILVTPTWIHLAKKKNESSLLFKDYQHKDFQTYAIEYALMNMKEDGISYVFVQSSFLNNHHYEDFFQHLLKHKYIQKVILLSKEDSLSDAIIVLKKDITEKVCFIDATSLSQETDDRTVKSKSEDLLSAINKGDNKYIRYIYEEDFIINHYSLYPRLYFKIPSIHPEIPSGYRYLKIREFLKPIENYFTMDWKDLKTVCETNGGKGHIIKSKDLTPHKFSYECEFAFGDHENMSNGEIYASLDKNLILMPNFGSFYENPMLYVHYNRLYDVYITKSVKAFDYVPSLIDPLYFCHEFQKEYIQIRLSENRMLNWPTSNFDEILDIKMLVPSIEVQKAVYKEEERAYHLSKLQELDFEKILEKERKAYMDDLDCKRHNIGQILERINQGAENIFIKIKKYKESDNEMFNKIIRKMESHIENINLLSDKIELLTTPCLIAKGKDIDLRKRIYDYPSTEKYEVIYDVSDLDRMGHDNAIVSIGKENLDVIMDNILTNACKHGFIKEEKHIVKIKLSFDINRDYYILEISNNGKAMPEHMDTYRYGIRGEKGGPTANTGLGGYQVRTIVEHFKGSYEVVNDPSSMFPVKIIIKLPKYIK